MDREPIGISVMYMLALEGDEHVEEEKIESSKCQMSESGNS